MTTTTKSSSQVTDSYVFAKIKKKIATFPKETLLDLGIGDTSLPLHPAIGSAMQTAILEMQKSPIGYGPEVGYPALREQIAEFENVPFNEIFVTDGIAPSLGHILGILKPTSIGIPAIAYPQYLHAAKRLQIPHIVSLPCENGVPVPPEERVDVLILNSPVNPTGVAMTKEQLAQWVQYAKIHGALILFDGAYRSFIQDPNIPKSIYAIEGARDVAVELCSFSKSAGFSGLRLGYTIIPEHLPLHANYLDHITTMTNGIAYPIQKGGQAALKHHKELEKAASIYMAGAQLLQTHIPNTIGGQNCPYVWWKYPSDCDSFTFFDELLSKHQIVTIPGTGFGPAGQGYVRLSGFAPIEIISEAIERIQRSYL